MSKLILFQGDSITDAGRSYERDDIMGRGYATMVAGRLGYTYPEEYSFLNRGISGNRIVDIYARMKKDIITLKPDYMSLLIGVNDVWHEFSDHNGVATDKFEKIYTMLIDEIKEALPNMKLMLIEPFVLKGSATTSSEEYSDLYSRFRRDVEDKAKCVKRIAEKYSIPFIPLQEKFDSLYNPEKPTYWLFDGVHPNASGHALIADEWIRKFEEIK